MKCERSQKWPQGNPQEHIGENIQVTDIVLVEYELMARELMTTYHACSPM